MKIMSQKLFSIPFLILFLCIHISSYAAKSPSGQLRMALNEDPESLNPLLSTSDYAVDVQTWACDSLLRRDLDSYAWQGGIADKWDLAKDNSSVTFQLRENVYFHNGEKLKAEDIQFSFDIYKKAGAVSLKILKSQRLTGFYQKVFMMRKLSNQINWCVPGHIN
jgi:ABC-type transport system substrate-binding protein